MYKDPEKQRAAWRKYYHTKGKARSQEGARARRERDREFVWQYKNSHPCEMCGESDPVVLEFDHRDNKDKVTEIASMVSDGYSLERIAKEIEKCRVLCANCHRRVTWHQRQKGLW